MEINLVHLTFIYRWINCCNIMPYGNMAGHKCMLLCDYFFLSFSNVKYMSRAVFIN